MRVYISGGCKNGKTTFAQDIAVAMAAGRLPLYYIATMQPCDDEDRSRIAAHRAGRAGLGFTTLELPDGLGGFAKTANPNACYLLDSTTALLANAMFPPGGGMAAQAHEQLARELTLLLQRLPHVVAVSDYIFADAHRYDPATEHYRKGLAYLDKQAAALCDVVLEACYGCLIAHKGGALLGEVYEAPM